MSVIKGWEVKNSEVKYFSLQRGSFIRLWLGEVILQYGAGIINL